jgi:hypothetical protein
MPTGMQNVPFSELVVGEEFEIHYPGYYCACVKLSDSMYKNLVTGLERSIQSSHIVPYVWPDYHTKVTQAASQQV